jgi:hypothetical protein
MEFDHVSNRYLYPDRYIKMIPYFLNNLILFFLEIHSLSATSMDLHLQVLAT